MRKKQILIRNAENVENYLGLDVRGRQRLKRLDLRENRRVRGVRELLARIPGGFDLDRMEQFYQETGLKLRVTHYNDQYEVRYYDRNGIYPAIFLDTYRADWAEISAALPRHPEWLEPQEECDIEIRYIDSIDENLMAG